MPDAQAVLVEVISIITSTGKKHYGVLVATPTQTEHGVKLTVTVHYGSKEQTMSILFDHDMIGWNDMRAAADGVFQQLTGWPN